ncbi:MAG: hypothetical protein Q9191_007758 [Dirinaria sp. TL-2023a]
MKSFLDHVANCEWLSDTDYWCPGHRQFEHFGLHEKDSKLKRAYEFFKSFGCINRRDSSDDRIYAGKPENNVTYLNKRNLSDVHEKPEMEAHATRTQELEGTLLSKRKSSLASRSEMPAMKTNSVFKLYASRPRTMASEPPSYSRVEMPAMKPDFLYGSTDWHSSPLQTDRSQSSYTIAQHLANTASDGSRVYMTNAGSSKMEWDRAIIQELRLSTQTMGPFEIGHTEHSTHSGCLVDAEPLEHSQAYAPTQVQGSISQGSANVTPNERSLILDRDIPSVENLTSPISPTSTQCANHYSPATVSPLISPTNRVNPSQPTWESQSWNTSTQCSPDRNDIAQGENCSHGQNAAVCTSVESGIDNNEQTSVVSNISMRSQSPGDIEQCLPSVNPSEDVYVSQGHRISSDEPSEIYAAGGEMPTTEVCPQQGADLSKRCALSTRQYVEKLDQLMRMLDKLWQEKLEDWPELWILSDGIRSGSPFEARLEILRQCLTGNFPSEIQYLFPLMHLAYACAYMCHCDDASYNWDSFYKNVLQWASLISDRQDQYRFRKIADILWSTPRTFLDFGTQLQSTIFDQTPQSSQARPARLDIRDSWVVPNARDTLTGDIHPDIRHGVVLETCAMFLDGFAYSRILERLNTVEPDGLNSTPLRSIVPASVVLMVIVPLLQQSRYSDFHSTVENTWTALDAGKLHNIREVELFLSAHGLHSCDSGQACTRYRNEVTLRCQQAGRFEDLMLRHHYYLSQVERLQELWNEFDKKRQGDFEHTPLLDRYSQVQSFPNKAQAFCAEPTSAISDGTSSIGTTLGSISCSLIPMSTNTSSQGTLLTSSSNSSSATSTPSSLPSPDRLQIHMGATAQGVTYCGICHQPFTGKLQNRLSNVRRHLRHIHHEGEPLVCSEPGCDETFGRKDILRLHRNKAHNIESPVRETGSKRQRRLSK